MTEEFYFAQIEAAWQSHQRRPLLLSTIDWGYIEAWQQAEIPLTVVLLAIERTFENFRPQHAGDWPRTLRYCWPEILKAMQETPPPRSAYRNCEICQAPREEGQERFCRNCEQTRTRAERGPIEAGE